MTARYAESRALPLQPARDKVSTKPSGFSEEVLKRGVGRKRKEPWVLSCFILDMELQVQPLTWDLSDKVR